MESTRARTSTRGRISQRNAAAPSLIGKQMVLQEMHARPGLNGRMVNIERYDNGTGLFGVRLMPTQGGDGDQTEDGGDGEMVIVKMVNLQRPVAAETGGSSSPRSPAKPRTTASPVASARMSGPTPYAKDSTPDPNAPPTYSVSRLCLARIRSRTASRAV